MFKLSVIQSLSQIALVTGLTIIGFQLLLDPWMYERLQRLIRENCRIENQFLRWRVDEKISEIRNFIAIILLMSAGAAFIMDGFLKKTLNFVLIITSFLIWNPNMLMHDEKFTPVLMMFIVFALSMSIQNSSNEDKNISTDEEVKKVQVSKAVQ